MGSSRLPGKVLMNIDGKPMIKFMFDRVKKSKLVDKIIIATSTNENDNQIYDICKVENISCFRGSEEDVLDRYYRAAVPYNPKIIVRLTADCPLIDPNIIDSTINLLLSKKVDFAANTVPPEIKMYPDGSDVEVFSFENLKTAWINSKDPNEREHVTFYFWKSNNNFTTALLKNKSNWGKYRITIDYKEDFILLKEIINRLKQKNKFGYIEEIIEIFENEPSLYNINSMYTYGLNW